MPFFRQFLTVIKRQTFLFLLLAFIYGGPEEFAGEVLHYSAGFRIFPAGQAVLSFTSDSLQGEPVYLLTTSVRTNAFLDAFYEVRDEIKSWLNPEFLSLKKTIKKIREGNLHRDHEAVIQGDSLAVWSTNSKILPGKVYDPVAFVYYLRTQDLQLGDSYSFHSYSRKKIRKVIVDITAKETIRVSAGTFNCLKVEPISPDGKPLLKNNGEMRVWLSDDNLKLPVKIEMKTNVGTMVMKLKDYKYISR